MEKLVEKGLVRSIGLSNFNSCQIDDILSVAIIKPTVLQVTAALLLTTQQLLQGGTWLALLKYFPSSPGVKKCNFYNSVKLIKCFAVVRMRGSDFARMRRY